MADLRQSLNMSQLTSMASLLDVPAITLPVGHDELENMPVGLTLMSTSEAECDLYHMLPLAQEFETITRTDPQLKTRKPDIYFGDTLLDSKQNSVIEQTNVPASSASRCVSFFGSSNLRGSIQ